MKVEKKFFARIIELKYHQCLLTKVKTDNDEVPFAVRVETDIFVKGDEEVPDQYKRVGVNLGFKQEHEVDNCFSSLLMSDVQEIVENMMLKMDIYENPYESTDTEIIK